MQPDYERTPRTSAEDQAVEAIMRRARANYDEGWSYLTESEDSTWVCLQALRVSGNDVELAWNFIAEKLGLPAEPEKEAEKTVSQ